MRYLLVMLTLMVFSGCGGKYRKTIDSYSSGKIKLEYVYRNVHDTSDYQIFEYFPDGGISFKGTVNNGKFIGTKVSYYDNGNIKSVDSILNPCDLHFCCCDGKVLKYYRNGKLDQTFENRNGVTNGFVTIYKEDSSGTISSITNYINDRKNGMYKIFYSSGNIYERATYKDDTLIGNIYYFEENGDTSKIYYTYKGKQDFPGKRWLRNGQVLYMNYADSLYNKVIYKWVDKQGKELKKQLVFKNKNGQYLIPN